MNFVDGNIEFDTKLVELVRCNPVLHGKELRNCPYDTMRKQAESWKSIAVSLNSDSRFCISRWKVLKNRFKRELQKRREYRGKRNDGKDSVWLMYDKLLFLTSHTKYHGLYEKGTHSHKQISCNTMEAEISTREMYNDDPLQEAMDEQSNSERDRNEEAAIALANSTIVSGVSMAEQFNKNMQRIAILLEGIDDANRAKAEKRIIKYLCQCQIQSINNEDVDGIQI